jgi:hypothetical protein
MSEVSARRTVRGQTTTARGFNALARILDRRCSSSVKELLACVDLAA